MKKLTRGTRKLIDYTIEKQQLNIDQVDTTELVDHICIEVEEKYPGKSLDYNLQRMGLEKTSDVQNAVNTYLTLYHKKKEQLKKKEGESD